MSSFWCELTFLPSGDEGKANVHSSFSNLFDGFALRRHMLLPEAAAMGIPPWEYKTTREQGDW